MQTLERKFLEKSGILPKIKESLTEIGFPEDPERLALIEDHLDRTVSQFFEPRHLEVLVSFFETDTGKIWLDKEIPLLQETEKLIAAHVAYAKGDYILRELNLSNDSYSDDELDDLPNSQTN